MVNEAPKTIASFACNRLHAFRVWLKCLWGYVREECEIFQFGLTWNAGYHCGCWITGRVPCRRTGTWKI